MLVIRVVSRAVSMTNISKVTIKAIAVLSVICIPLFVHHIVKKETDSTSASIPADEPEFAAANPVDANSWVELSDIENGRFESTVIQYRDDLYVFNGFGVGINVEPTVEKFDAGTQTWSVIGNTSIVKGNAVTHNGVIRHGNEVWILGGRLGNHPGAVTANVWIFDLVSHEWTEGPKLPVPIAAGGAALVENRIHWFGGLDANAQCDVANHYVYDLDEPSAGWEDISSIAPMPIPRNHFATVVYEGLIYAIGGQFTHDGCGPGTPDTDLVHVFNPETNTWTQRASLPAIQSHIEPSTFVYEGAIYVVGGATSGNKVYRYDPSNDIWATVAELPQALLAPVARVIDGRLIVSSGGAPSIIPSNNTYATDMTTLLLPGAELLDTDTGENLADTETEAFGLLTLEAEFHDSIDTTATHQWIAVNSADASNNQAMTTTPDNKTLFTGAQGSPSLTYFAFFDRPGKWYLWIRGSGDTVNGEGGSDSLHAGLNGSLSETADKIDNFPPAWSWSNSTRDGVRASLNIPAAGIHAVNLWMREDGLAVDKILLTTDSNYQPSGIGDTPVVNGPSVVDQESANNDTLAGSSNENTLPDSTDDNANNSDEDTLTDAPEIVENNTTPDAANSVTDNSETITDSSTSNIEIVSIEVENFDTVLSASNKQWVRSDQSGASGNASMVTTPDSGTLKISNQGSPVMNYQVHFEQAGTYNVWLRGWGDTLGNEGKSDSVHVGINGTLGPAAAIQNFPSTWHWSSDTRSGSSAKLIVPSAGLHTINIWMREDGLILDKLVLAKSTTFIPSGVGPAANSSTAETTANDESATVETDSGTAANTDAVTDEDFISVEVENFASKSADGAHQWLDKNQSGASGSAMEATPNTGKLNANANGSAVMNYPLQFVEPGTYVVWLRGWGDSNGQGKNDSVHVGINGNLATTQVLENFPNGWTWSNNKRGGGSVTVSIPTAGLHTINLSMREDGIILDKLLLTKDTAAVPTGIGPNATVEIVPSTADEQTATSAAVTENFVAVRIEAEDFTSKNERWVLTSPGNTPNFLDDPDGPHNASASGNANLELLPDTRVTHADPTSGGPDGSLWGNPGPGPSIDYLVNLPEPGRYLVYVKTFSTGSEDNGIHVGINDTTPTSGRRIQTCAKNRWFWTSAQRTDEEHCGVDKQIWLDVPVAGTNMITFYAREDGFELDQFLLLKETHDGTLDCYPTLDDEVRCENLATGARISETDIPLSATVNGSDNASNTDSFNTDTASNISFGSRWLN